MPLFPPPSLFPLVTQGDSGGPVVKEVDGRNVLVGVVSWGTRWCGVGYPGVNTRVGYEENYEWITDTVCDAANELPQWCPRTATLSTIPATTTITTTTILPSLVSHLVGSGFPVTSPSTPLTTTTASTKTTTTILPIIQICNEEKLKSFLVDYSSISCAYLQSESPSMQIRICNEGNAPMAKTKCPYSCTNKCS